MEATQWRQFLSRVIDYVGAARYPATKAEIIAQATRGNVPSDLRSQLWKIPDRTYQSVQEVVAAVEEVGPPPAHVK